MSIGLCVAFLVIATPPSCLCGQGTGLAAAMRSLSAGDSVRLEAAGLGRVEGRFIASNGTAVTLASHAGSLKIPLGDLERLWVRGRATQRGALIGSIAGVVVGIAGGLAISGVACNPVDGGDCTALEVAAVTGLLGGAGGAVVGAGVGFAVPVWRLRFPWSG
jgi:hypothetical protein